MNRSQILDALLSSMRQQTQLIELLMRNESGAVIPDDDNLISPFSRRVDEIEILSSGEKILMKDTKKRLMRSTYARNVV